MFGNIKMLKITLILSSLVIFFYGILQGDFTCILGSVSMFVLCKIISNPQAFIKSIDKMLFKNNKERKTHRNEKCNE